MGNTYAYYISHPDTTPPGDMEPTFDPQIGFPNGRKPRVMVATEEEMISVGLPKEFRDYCAHKLIDYQVCRRDVWPFVYKCAGVKHDYLNCEYDDYILRMKEYERERRLLERQKRKQQAEASA